MSDSPHNKMSSLSASGTVRSTALTVDEVVRFSEQGFLLPGRVLDEAQLERLREALERARNRERESGREYDLLNAEFGAAGDAKPNEKGKSVGLLINLCHWNQEFREVAFTPILARWAAQLIGCRQLRLLEDDAIYKMPGKGGSLMWHQDYPYWPIAQPNAITAWLALDDTTVANGAMRMAVGTHLTGETLPAAFGTGKPYFQKNRPRTVQPIGDPEILGYDVLPIELRAGEVSLHHALTWHSSTANESTIPRRAFVVRYVADGTIWLGARRYEEYRLPVDAGVVEGEPLSGRYFPVVPF